MLNKLHDTSIIYTHPFGCNSLRIVHPRRLLKGILMQDGVLPPHPGDKAFRQKKAMHADIMTTFGCLQ
jgi:hypothetical protein